MSCEKLAKDFPESTRNDKQTTGHYYTFVLGTVDLNIALNFQPDKGSLDEGSPRSNKGCYKSMGQNSRNGFLVFREEEEEEEKEKKQ
ncbi:hypothetical protein HZH68_013261 [Vespula germanica]|uniref:Uncharacterized protein n=1 Tax=Vespula germanica TaxID=30212 RepID=A0A834JFH7_VESGE|nr:hypothetical protein HZH68_013261 [Vespula germanica]